MLLFWLHGGSTYSDGRQPWLEAQHAHTHTVKMEPRGSFTRWQHSEEMNWHAAGMEVMQE